MNLRADEVPGGPEEMVPATVPELARFLEANSKGARNPVLPVGGRTSLGFGFAPLAGSLMVATSRLDRVIDYPARDMTVTVEAGCRVATLQELLKSENHFDIMILILAQQN